MAELPIEVDNQAIVPRTLPPGLEVLPGPDFLKGIGGLPVIRQIMLMLTLVASVALGVYVVQWMTATEYTALSEVGNLAVSEVADLLDSEEIPYQLNSGLLTVPTDNIHAARMLIARAGIVSGDQSGFELLDEEQGFGVSQFSENAKHIRALQGEIVKSIETIDSVRKARVLLNIPRNSGFLRDRRAPTASVTLTLARNYEPSSQEVRAITNLVAGSVSGLTEGNVSIVSQNGVLLSQESDNTMRQSNQQLGYVKSIEHELLGKLQRQLGIVLGNGNFTAAVTAEMDFTWVEQTDELYNADLPALRSEFTTEKTQEGASVIGGIPGALSNQPPGAASTPETLGEAEAGTRAGGNTRPRNIMRETTRNNELDRTISHTRHQTPLLKRITVSVFVDDKLGDKGAENEAGYRPWTVQELEALTISLQTTVGYDAARSDKVTVQNITFPREKFVEAPPLPFWAEPWFYALAKMGVGGLVLLLITFVLLRPLFTSLAKAGEEHTKAVAKMQVQVVKAAEAARNIGQGSANVPTGMIGLADSPEYEEKIAMVKNMVADNPARVAQVVKQWTVEDE